ncbi:MAG: sugar transferase [Mycobacteriaceae bacterium]|nr:sugar transferase [Mycobacteriaceae bacterium]
MVLDTRVAGTLGSAVPVGSFGRQRWQARYVRYLFLTDSIVVSIAVSTAQLVRFGDPDDAPPLAWSFDAQVGYTAVSTALALLWNLTLALVNARAPRVIGSGADEYRRLVSATFGLFGLIAIGGTLLRVEIARGYLAIAFPLGLAGLIAGRWAWRRQSVRIRQAPRAQGAVLVVGGRQAAHAMTMAFARSPEAGYRVVGICLPSGGAGGDTHLEVGGQRIPVIGDDRSVPTAVRRTGADTVAVTATDQLGPDLIRDLVWELEPMGVDLIVAPGLVDIAAPRLTSRPVAGMAMLHVEKPQYDRAKSLGKAVFDRIFALTALLAAGPALIVAAIAVKATSPGPVFYRSERIGMNGKPFHMIKFRTMFQDADRQMAALIASHGGNPLFFKLKNDPRVTSVGKILRKYSLDELPQFFNVLTGEMSVVGPRPQVRREVDSYDQVVRRRLLVKPGITGLWQVSGRSDLSLEDAVRLDLSYVENWSMVLDLHIVSRTLSAVTRGAGAY